MPPRKRLREPEAEAAATSAKKRVKGRPDPDVAAAAVAAAAAADVAGGELEEWLDEAEELQLDPQPPKVRGRGSNQLPAATLTARARAPPAAASLGAPAPVDAGLQIELEEDLTAPVPSPLAAEEPALAPAPDAATAVTTSSGLSVRWAVMAALLAVGVAASQFLVAQHRAQFQPHLPWRIKEDSLPLLDGPSAKRHLLGAVEQKLDRYTRPMWDEIARARNGVMAEEARLAGLLTTVTQIEATRTSLRDELASLAARLARIESLTPLAGPDATSDGNGAPDPGDVATLEAAVAALRQDFVSHRDEVSGNYAALAGAADLAQWSDMLDSLSTDTAAQAAERQSVEELFERLQAMSPIPTKDQVEEAARQRRQRAAARAKGLGYDLVQSNSSVVQRWVREVAEKAMPVNHADLSAHDADALIKREVDSFVDTDCSGMVDFAWSRAGATVLQDARHVYTSESFNGGRGSLTALVNRATGFQDLHALPETAISKGLNVGECWAFRGQEGRLTVKLANPARVTHVTVLHAHANISPDTSSAPKLFRVLGFAEHDAALTDPVYLGNGTYRDDSDSNCQVFAMDGRTDHKMSHVTLHVLENHGKPDFTCLYRFMVHNSDHRR